MESALLIYLFTLFIVHIFKYKIKLLYTFQIQCTAGFIMLAYDFFDCLQRCECEIALAYGACVC